MGVVVADEESRASRHLRHCAMEQNILMTVSYCCYHSQATQLFFALEIRKTINMLIWENIFCSQDFLNILQSVSWITKCLYAGQLIPLEEKRSSQCPPAIKHRRQPEPMELSQEI